jgi:SAM-dependent methyltransferase
MMDKGINVEEIVAQIRSRIAANPARKVSVTETTYGPSKDAERLRTAIEEDAARFAELDAGLEASGLKIGHQPLAPPTWRGRIGAMAVSVVRRLIWWYTPPIKELAAQIHLRNREQALRHRQLQEHMLVWTRDLVAVLERTQTIERISGVIEGIQRDLSTCNRQIHLLRDQVDERFREATQDCSEFKAQLAEVVDDIVLLKSATDREANQQLRESLLNRVESCESTVQHLATQVRSLGSLPRLVSDYGLAIQKQRSELSICEHKIAMVLRELRSQLPEPLTLPQLEQITKESDDAIALLYAEFEDVFRGPRDEIKQRQNIYLTRVQEAGAGGQASPVLDLGSGRGEWLELLSEHQLVGIGVDRNPGMIKRCRELNLNVSQGDVLPYLNSLPDRSMGAITSFHVVEHLQFESVITLIDECLRVLKPGGLLILETPNPQNTLVGSQTFWIDPTHNRPIPSQTLRFFVEARGFCDVEILALQPPPETLRVPDDGNPLTARFNEYFYGPQDYAVIGRRP